MKTEIVRKGFLSIFKLLIGEEKQKELGLGINAFEYMERGDCVSVLIVDDLSKNDPLVVMNKQFRVGPYVKEGVETSYSSAAGMIDEGEVAMIAAIREAKEETGLDIRSIKEMNTMYTSPGGTTERCTFFLAEANFDRKTQLTPLDTSEGITCEIQNLSWIDLAIKKGDVKSLQFAYQVKCLQNVVLNNQLKQSCF